MRVCQDNPMLAWARQKAGEKITKDPSIREQSIDKIVSRTDSNEMSSIVINERSVLINVTDVVHERM